MAFGVGALAMSARILPVVVIPLEAMASGDRLRDRGLACTRAAADPEDVPKLRRPMMAEPSGNL
jgi:hypothetical protein